MNEQAPDDESSALESLPIALDRDVFIRSLLRELAGALEEIVGLDEASGFISVVGQRIGETINARYVATTGGSPLSRDQIAGVLVDLKRRIQGDFYVIEATEDKIVLGNRACPFGEKVLGRPSLCMMTSNVFGFIASDNLGFAKVAIEEAIARGDSGCRVVVHLKQSDEAAKAKGREYFKG